MLSIVPFIVRLALVAVMTFLFVVLFEHGPASYPDNLRSDFEKLVESVRAYSTPPQ